MKSLPYAQSRALKAARDHGDPTKGLSGRSEWGGWTWTRAALIRAGLLDGATSQITELGRWRIALDLGEIAKDTPPPGDAPAGPRP